MNARHKQIAVISANSATTFEKRANSILKRVSNPRIVFDPHRSLTAYIVYDTSNQKEKASNGK